MALGYSTAIRNAMLDAITSAAGASALLKIYDGARPGTTGGTATNVLATLTCNATFAPASSGGVLTLNAITSGTGTAAAGAGTTATWFRITTSGGTLICDGSISTTGSDLNLSSTTIANGQTVAISSFTITEGNP
jgi:hypothetical protein